MKFVYAPTTNKRQHSKAKRSLSSIKWIVIHWTANTRKGAGATAHKRYLDGASRLGSAHYYVDDREIVQTIGDSYIAWSVGDNQGHGRYLNGCTNANSVSVEMCVNQDADLDKTYKNVLELTKNLMKKFGIDAEHVCRHYDVSRKDCPHNFRADNWKKWRIFKEQIKEPIAWAIDLSKDSEFGDGEVFEAEDEDKEADMRERTETERARAWCRDNGISDGLNPKASATREELAVMLYRALNAGERKDFSKVRLEFEKEPT